MKDIHASLDNALANVIQALEETGLRFTIATGKNLNATKATAEALGISMPMVLSNGCVIQTLDGDVLQKTVLPEDFVLSLIKICADERIELAIHIDEDIYVREITHNTSILFDYGSPNLVDVKEWSQITHLLPKAYKCIALDRKDRQRLFALEKKVFASAGNKVEYCHTLVEMLEFMPEGISKVSGIRSIAQHLNTPMQSILAMGDGNNDIGMLRAAGYGVAVENAPQAVRDAANWIIPSCASGGPIGFLKHFLAMRRKS